MKVTVPDPVTWTDGVYEVCPLLNEPAAVPVAVPTTHDGLPNVPLPLRLKLFPPTAAHWAAGGEPALAVGFGFTVTVTSLVAVPHDGV